MAAQECTTLTNFSPDDNLKCTASTVRIVMTQCENSRERKRVGVINTRQGGMIERAKDTKIQESILSTRTHRSTPPLYQLRSLLLWLDLHVVIADCPRMGDRRVSMAKVSLQGIIRLASKKAIIFIATFVSCTP